MSEPRQSDLCLRSGKHSLQATRTEPAPGGTLGAVLMLRGLTGHRDELSVAGGAGSFVLAAAQLTEAGITSLRIEFAGSSEGDWADLTLDGRVADAVAAYDPLAAEGRPVGVLGYSLGGLMASHLVAARPEAVALPLLTFQGLLGRPAFERAQAADPAKPIRALVAGQGETVLRADLSSNSLPQVPAPRCRSIRGRC